MMEARQYPGMLPSVSYKPRMMGINFPSSMSLLINIDNHASLICNKSIKIKKRGVTNEAGISICHS